MAIVPFGWEGGQALSEDLAGIIDNDLSRSGMFKTMDRADMLSSPAPGDEVFFRDWRLSGNDYMVIGSVSPTATGIQATAELYDVLKEQRIWTETVDVSQADLRDVGHYFADKVFEKLTGIRGAFSTRVVYVTAANAGGQREYKLQMADSDGARPRTILSSQEPIMSPAWSRDGSRLAYVSFETGRPSIYIQHLATGQRQKIQIL